MAQGAKKLNYVTGLTDEAHALLRDQANARGIRIEQHAAHLLNEIALDWQPPDEDASAARRSYWLAVKAQQISRARSLVMSTAQLVARYPDDTKLVDILKEQCDLADLDLEDVKTEAQNTPLILSAINNGVGGKLGACVTWLITMFGINDTYPSVLLEELARQENFAPATLTRAIKAINRDQTMWIIVTERRPAGWVKILKELEEPKDTIK